MGLFPEELPIILAKREREARLAGFEELRALMAEASEAHARALSGVAARLKFVSDENSRLSGESSAVVGRIQDAIAGAGYAKAEELSLVEAKITTAEQTILATIQEQRLAQVNANEALARRTITFRTDLDGATARITTVEQALSSKADNGDLTALAERTTTLETSVADPTTGLSAAHSRITTVETSLTTKAENGDLTALATRTTALESTVNHVDTGLAAANARITSNEQAITTLQQDGDVTALATRVEDLEVTVNDPATGLVATEGRLTTVESSYATTTFVETKKTETLTAAAGDAQARVDVEAGVRASAIGDIHQYWGVQFDVNGNVTGRVRLDGSQNTTTFSVLANAIVFSNGATSVAPFTIENGLVKMTNALFSGNVLIGEGANQTEIDGTGLRVGQVTIDGVSNQNDIKISGSNPVTITGGAISAMVSVGLGITTASLVSNTDGGTLSLGGAGSRIYCAGDGWVRCNANFEAAGTLQVGGEIKKITSDGWTLGLNDGDNVLSLRWSSRPELKVDASTFLFPFRSAISSAITDPSSMGGFTEDTEARAAISEIIQVLQAWGMTS